MATKRRRIGARRLKDAAAMPLSVRWWLDHGRPLGIAEAQALGMDEAAAWQISALAFDRATVSGWSRRDLRDLGYGRRLDELVAAGLCAPDRR